MFLFYIMYSYIFIYIQIFKQVVNILCSTKSMDSYYAFVNT